MTFVYIINYYLLLLYFLDSVFDPNQKILLDCINSSNHESNVAKLREEVKNLTSEINSKRKEINIISAQEEGVRNNIKYLKEIIAIKVIILKLFILIQK